MLTTDETKEVRVVLNKLEGILIDIEFGNTDEVMEKGIDTLKMVKTSYMNFVSELAKADRKLSKKPKKYIAFDGIERNGCPSCPRNEILYVGQKYCSVCGQKIDWICTDYKRNLTKE